MQLEIADHHSLRRQRPKPASRPAPCAKRTVAAGAQRDLALLNALSIIVHDLRGPLANLGMLIELIETYATLEASDRIKRSTDKASQLIDTLDAMLTGVLERVRQTGDPLAFRPGLVDAGDVLAKAADLNRPLADNRGISLEVRATEPCVVSGDARLLHEAVDNLIGNAVKYAPENSTVVCEATVRDRKAVLSVTDAGAVLAESELRQAFRPFATLSTRLEGRGGSCGLGLWIVRLIAERHFGRVNVSVGARAGGTRFEIVLPL